MNVMNIVKKQHLSSNTQKEWLNRAKGMNCSNDLSSDLGPITQTESKWPQNALISPFSLGLLHCWCSIRALLPTAKRWARKISNFFSSSSSRSFTGHRITDLQASLASLVHQSWLVVSGTSLDTQSWLLVLITSLGY